MRMEFINPPFINPWYSEEAFRDLFGISQERFVYMLRQKKESDNNHSDLPRQISLALSGSTEFPRSIVQFL